MRPTPSQRSAISRLFSSAVFRELATKGRSPLFARLFNQSLVDFVTKPNAKVLDAFESAFAVLRTNGLRDEYVYRAALTHKVLLGTHSLRTACMLSEFRTGTCKADVAILNGTSTVYEIKSERDSLTRLENQLENYKRVFAKAYVIASEDHIPSIVESTSTDVGVICLSRRHQIKTIRVARERADCVCPVSIFESVRTTEACAILQYLGLPIPDVPNTRMHLELCEVFRGLRPADVHSAMVATLKRTRNLAPLAQLLDRVPASLQPAALSVAIRRSDHNLLVQAIETPLVSALMWA